MRNVLWRRPSAAALRFGAALAGLALLATPFSARAFTVLERPVRVPLTWVPIHWGGAPPAPRKLGIHVALGGSREPQLFEFDTGGAGFYPTYAAAGGVPTTPWWGDSGESTGFRFEQSYDSGAITYRGAVVRTSVSLFAGPGPGTPLLTAHDVLVGRTDTINDIPLAPPFQTPPLEGAFWGDFGMALKAGKKGEPEAGGPQDPRPVLDSLLAQLRPGPDVRPGYRVHASSSDPWMQFGLGPDDRPAAATTFALNPPDPPTPSRSPAGVPYGNDLVISGTLAVRDAATTFVNAATGIILDTGAYTTIHNHGDTFPDDLRDGGSVVVGAEVVIAAPRREDGGGLGPTVPFLRFLAGSTVNEDLVWVKDASSYYLNTGLLPFLDHDVLVDLEAGILSLVPARQPQAVPAPSALAGVLAAGRAARLLRGRRRHP